MKQEVPIGLPNEPSPAMLLGRMLLYLVVVVALICTAILGLLLFGEKKLGRRGHWVAALLVCVGAWISGYFIVATNAFMQKRKGNYTGS